MTNNYEVTQETARRALVHVDPNERALWVKMGAALKSHFGEDGFNLFDDWSATAGNYDAKAVKTTWKGFKSSGGITIGSLVYEAKRGGFDPKTQASNAPSEAQTTEAREKRARERAAKDAAEAVEVEKQHHAAAQQCTDAFNRAAPDGVSHYLGIKGVNAHGVRFETHGDAVTVLVPLSDNTGKIWNVQRITNDGAKLFAKGARVSGLYHLIGEYTDTGWVLVAEGYATAATLHELTGYPVAVGFNAMNLKPVCLALRERFPTASILVCADNDKETEERTGKNGGVVAAQNAAKAVGGCIVIPQGLPLDKSDFNDLFHLPIHLGGGDQVKQQIESAIFEADLNVARGLDGANDNSLYEKKPVPKAKPTSKPSTKPKGNSDNNTRDAGGKFKHVPKHFTCDKDGVFFHETKDGEPKKTFISSPLHVTAKTRNADNDGWGYLLEFEDVGGNPKRWLMPASMLNADGAAYRGVLLDMGLLIDTSSNARTLLNRYIQSSKVNTLARCATKTGWYDDAFVLPDRSIGEAEGERVIFQTGRVSDSPFRQKGTLDDWRDNVAALCVGNSRLLFAVCSAFAGVLLEPAGVQSGGFHFVGDSSVGKSTALFVAASVYGSRRRFVKTWRATDASLESTAEQHSDTLLILDELAQVDPKIIGDVVYMLGNEQGKGRNKNTGGARSMATWRVLYLSSGEISLSDHMKTAGKTAKAGQETRLVNVNADAGKGFGLFDTLCGFPDGQSLAKHLDSATRDFYGLAGVRFIEHVVKHIESLRETLKSEVQNLAHDWTPSGAHGQVSRVAQRFALVALAGELASEAGITGWADGEAISGVKACFDAWLDERGGAGNSELERMREQAIGVISTNAGRFTYWHRALDAHAPSVSNRLGFKRLFEGNKPLDESKAAFIGDPNPETRFDASDCVEVYYVLPDAFKNEICKGFNHKTMAAYLVSIGFIEAGKDGATTPHRLPTMGLQRCYKFIHHLSSI